MVKLVIDVAGTPSDKTLQIKAGNLTAADAVVLSDDEADDSYLDDAVYKDSESLHRRACGAFPYSSYRHDSTSTG